MSLGRRGAEHKQESIWIEAGTLARPSGHPFYQRLNALLDKQGFDCFAEQACAGFYSRTGRPGLAPGDDLIRKPSPYKTKDSDHRCACASSDRLWPEQRCNRTEFHKVATLAPGTRVFLPRSVL